MCDIFFFQAEDGIRDLVRSRGLGDVYKRQEEYWAMAGRLTQQRRVEDEGFRVVNSFSGGRGRTVPWE